MGLDYYFLQQTPEITMGIAILLLVAIVGARANFVSFLYDSEINSAVKAAQAVFHAEISLRSADSEAHTQIVREIQTELGKHLAESLKNVTDRINGAISQGKQVSEQLLKKAAELAEKMKEIGGNVWQGIKDTFGSIINGIGSGMKAFGDWIGDLVQKGVEAAKPHIENIKQMAKETLDNLKTASQQVIDQAIEFFRPYREDLGKLWDQLVQAGKDIHAGIIGEGSGN